MGRGHVYLGIMAMVLLSICGPAKGQSSSPNTSCLAGITACETSLTNPGTPSSSCCSALKIEMHTEEECLCNLLNTTFLDQFNLNITQVKQLPVKCGLNVTASSCPNLSGNATAPSGSPPPPSAGYPPPPSAGSAPPPSSEGNSNSAASTLPLLALLLFGVVAHFQTIISSI